MDSCKQQKLGQPADVRDDVYSLGIIWYQLLIGDVTSEGPMGMWVEELEALGVSKELIRLLGRCVSPRPEVRPADAAELAAELARLLAAPRPARLITNSIGMKLTLIPAGTFLMGSPDTEPERTADEGPLHEVAISEDFYLGVYPVTQREYEAIVGQNPAYFHKGFQGGPDHPVEQVNWDEAVAFCQRLSNLPAEKAAGRAYRLPTEAEWEYACRAGTTTPFWFGTSASSKHANFDGRNPYGGASKGSYLERTSKVGSYPANPWGLFDMHGNVWEWCSDWFDENYFRNNDNNDPKGPPGNRRVLRGGAWDNGSQGCRSACRDGNDPGGRSGNFGFRVVLTLPPRNS
jgi:formylglycine-generating enzyme required for sulfatase activity